jgi:hypothetical protein
MTIDFEGVRTTGEVFYKDINEVYCPYFKDTVYFNAEGLEHLKFKRHSAARPQQDQYMRFKLLKLAPAILSITTTIQGIWQTKGFEKVRKYSRTELILQHIEYTEFIAVIDTVRVKIIVKQVEDGKHVFWSIIPFWGTDKRTTRRKLYSGDPVED